MTFQHEVIFYLQLQSFCTINRRISISLISLIKVDIWWCCEK